MYKRILFLLIIFYQVIYAYIGCCHQHGYGIFMMPCCHKYTASPENNCINNNIAGGRSIWYNMTCDSISQNL